MYVVKYYDMHGGSPPSTAHGTAWLRPDRDLVWTYHHGLEFLYSSVGVPLWSDTDH